MEEAEDLVELEVPEAYSAVTLKAMSMLRWAQLHFPELRYIIRALAILFLTGRTCSWVFFRSLCLVHEITKLDQLHVFYLYMHGCLYLLCIHVCLHYISFMYFNDAKGVSSSKDPTTMCIYVPNF